MKGYWVRHRLIFTLIMSVVLASIIGFLFVFPYVSQRANNYNSQSIYKNSDVDFIIPEPSFDQVTELQGTNGIDVVFPFFMTKIPAVVNGNSRTTTVLLTDCINNLDKTMYNSNRLIEVSKTEYDNKMYVDWQFCKDTAAKLGDSVHLTINGNEIEYRIYAIYETNTIYDGGAILVEMSAEQKDEIMQNSKNNGYSGAYVVASDYSVCRNYLTTDYRPLGRLRDASSFESEEQYQIHYDAIMSSGYANEITDFRMRETDSSKGNDILLYLGIALVLVVVIIFNVLMAKRGCEKVYFTKNCIPKGQNVKPYYNTSIVFEIILFVGTFVGIMIFKLNNTSIYIPKAALDIKILLVFAAVVVAEIICYVMNNIMLVGIAKKVKKEQERKEQEAKRNGNEG